MFLPRQKKTKIEDNYDVEDNPNMTDMNISVHHTDKGGTERTEIASGCTDAQSSSIQEQVQGLDSTMVQENDLCAMSDYQVELGSHQIPDLGQK